MNATTYQTQLLEKIKIHYPHLSKNVIDAFLSTPRHEYISEFYKGWRSFRTVVTDKNLEEHLDLLYSDEPVAIYIGNNDQYSSISQPSFVLKMIDMLDLKHGQKVFELGAGSGWNAALMSKLVGPEGKIVSLEIISELADRARETLKRKDITNVSILNQDGGPGYADEAPYDRAIFTAGSPDLPRAFFNQIKENGILLYIFKNQSGSDQLFLLHKKEDHFESSETFLCSFVPVTGKYAQKPNQVLTQNDLMARFNIANTIVHDHPFSWSSFAKISSVLEMDFLKFCFSISAQNYYMVEHDDGEISCAYVDPVSRSMALIKDESIVSYGNIEAVTKFMQELQKWMYAGKPSSHHLQLRVYPSSTKIRENEAQWIVRHEDSVFVWDASERISSALWPEQLN